MSITDKLNSLARSTEYEHVIELRVSGEFSRGLAEFLVRCGEVASGGHSFDIEADRDMAKEYSVKGDHYPKIGFDGDGSDRIVEVLFDGKKVKV
jgi:hypothetical protein